MTGKSKRERGAFGACQWPGNRLERPVTLPRPPAWGFGKMPHPARWVTTFDEKQHMSGCALKESPLITKQPCAQNIRAHLNHHLGFPSRHNRERTQTNKKYSTVHTQTPAAPTCHTNRPPADEKPPLGAEARLGALLRSTPSKFSPKSYMNPKLPLLVHT